MILNLFTTWHSKAGNILLGVIKPRTKRVAAIKIKAEPGLNIVAWHGYGSNANEKEGNLELKLDYRCRYVVKILSRTSWWVLYLGRPLLPHLQI